MRFLILLSFLTANLFAYLSPAGSAAAGVSSLNALTGNLSIVAGSGITVTPAGSSVTVAASGGGSGTVTSVGLGVPSIFTVSGSPVTGAGTLSFTANSQSQNLLWASPSGSSGAPTFRSLLGADLPNPAATTLGGILSYTAPSHQFLTTVTVTGSLISAQPQVADVAGAAPTASPTFTGTVSGIVEEFTGHIIAPANYTYVIDQSAAYAYTINSFIAQTSAGTITCAVKIGTTAVTGISAQALSSTPSTGTASGANSVSIGNQVNLVCVSNSSSADLSFTLKVTR